MKKTRKDKTSDQSRELKNEEFVIPVIAEETIIDKKIVKKGSVRVKKEVLTEEVSVDIPVINEQIDIERIAVHQYLDEHPDIRYEGDTVIIPVVQEVVEKRLLLVEEIHITKRAVTENISEKIIISKEKVSITDPGK